MEKVARKKKLGGYPALGVIFSITLILFALGLFGTLLIYSNEFGKVVRDNLNVKVYLKSTVPAAQRTQMEKNLASKAFVADTEQPVVFISKEKASEDLIKEIGDYKAVIGENPLKDAFIVKIKPALQDTTSLRKIKAEIEQINGVLEATYEKHLFDAVNKNLVNISLIFLVISLVMLVITFLLVNNTIRLALFSQRFLIRSMQLVGAKSAFIQWPFIYRAAVYGMLAGVVASLILWRLSAYSIQQIPELLQIHNPKQFMMLMGSLVGTGAVIAIASTFFAIRRYLRMSLDQLY